MRPDREDTEGYGLMILLLFGIALIVIGFIRSTEPRCPPAAEAKFTNAGWTCSLRPLPRPFDGR